MFVAGVSFIFAFIGSLKEKRSMKISYKPLLVPNQYCKSTEDG